MSSRNGQPTAAIAMLLLATVACAGRIAEGDTTRVSLASDGIDAIPAQVELPVVTDAVRDADLVLSIVTTAQVRSDAEATLRFEVAGTVDAVLVRPGDRVSKGQVLARLDPRPFELAIRRARTELEAAQLRYEADYLTDSVLTGRALTDKRRKAGRISSGLEPAQILLEQAALDYERATVVAPFAGMVDRVEVTIGERVGPGQDVTTVVDMERLRIEAAVLEHDIPLIRVGGTAVVTNAAAAGRPAHGTIVAVLPLIDSITRTGRAFVRARGTNALRPGMYADVQLEAARLANRRLVPSAAVIERDGRPLVFVVRNGRAQWTYIAPGRSNGVETEVLPDSSTGQLPVMAGDRVIVSGHLTLTHDARVREVRAGR